MKVQYDISISELKALIELVQELCHRNGLNEVVTKSLLKRCNKNFK